MEEPTVRKRKQPTYDEFPDFGKLPPQALEEEEAVLGALMIESNAFSQISEILRTPDYFYKVTHRKIFQAIRTLAAEGKPIDMLTVKDQLIKDNVRYRRPDREGGDGSSHRGARQNNCPKIPRPTYDTYL